MYWPGVRRQRHPTHHWDLRSEGPQRPYPFGADDADLRGAIEKPPERSRGLLIIDLPRTVNPRESADDQRLGRSQPQEAGRNQLSLDGGECRNLPFPLVVKSFVKSSRSVPDHGLGAVTRPLKAVARARIPSGLPGGVASQRLFRVASQFDHLTSGTQWVHTRKR
jgi:hypothetical protein